MVEGYYYKDSSVLDEGTKKWMEVPENTNIGKGEEIIASYHSEWGFSRGFTLGIMEGPRIIYGSLFLTNRRVIFCTPDEDHPRSSFAFNLDKTGELEDKWEFGNNVSFKFKKGGFFAPDYWPVVVINSINLRFPSAKDVINYLEGSFVQERKKSLEKNAKKLFDSQTDTDSILGAAANYKILGMGDKFDECITKLASKCERLQDFDSAIDYYKIINSEEDIIRLRKQKSDKVRVDQTVVQGDYVDDRDTIVKDSVLNRSNVGSGSSKMQELKDLTEMKEKGLIDDAEFKQMKKEILGK